LRTARRCLVLPLTSRDVTKQQHAALTGFHQTSSASSCRSCSLRVWIAFANKTVLKVNLLVRPTREREAQPVELLAIGGGGYLMPFAF
jgi:hypothetical protein